jgi:hypothetical protein
MTQSARQASPAVVISSSVQNLAYWLGNEMLPVISGCRRPDNNEDAATCIPMFVTGEAGRTFFFSLEHHLKLGWEKDADSWKRILGRSFKLAGIILQRRYLPIQLLTSSETPH